MDEGAAGAVVSLVLPSRPSYLALARVVIADVAAAGPSLRDSRLADLRLIVSELYTNAMEANWRATSARLRDEHDGVAPTREAVLDASPPVQMRVRVGVHEVEIAVRDSGTGFVGGDDPHPPVGDPTRLDFERGLGIPLVQFLGDRVDYESGTDGTEATVLVRDGDGGHSAG